LGGNITDWSYLLFCGLGHSGDGVLLVAMVA
jgi:hypothetical protein